MTQQIEKKLPPIGVIDNDRIVYLDLPYHDKPRIAGIKFNADSIQNIGQLSTIAHSIHVRQLWILPDSAFDKRMLDMDGTFVTGCAEDFKVFSASDNNDIEPFMATTPLTTQGAQVSLVIPSAFDETAMPHNIRNTHDVTHLLMFAVYIYQTTGMLFNISNKHMFMKLLQSTNESGNRKGFFVFQSDAAMQPFYDATATDISWSRPLTAEEIAAYKYVHRIDKNAAYLAAMSDCMIGCGPVVHQPHMDFDASKAAVWYATLSGNNAYTSGLYPELFTRYTLSEDGRRYVPTMTSWYDTNVVQSAIDCGFTVQIHEAYMHLTEHTVLNPVYKHLREARYELSNQNSTVYKHEQARRDTLTFVKCMYAYGTGLLGRNKEGERRKIYSRPDIRNAILGRCSARIRYNVDAFIKAGIPVACVYVDEIVYLSNEPFETSLPEGIVIDAVQCGKFKYKGSCLVSEVGAAFTQAPNVIVGILNKQCRQES